MTADLTFFIKYGIVSSNLIKTIIIDNSSVNNSFISQSIIGKSRSCCNFLLKINENKLIVSASEQIANTIALIVKKTESQISDIDYKLLLLVSKHNNNNFYLNSNRI